MKKLLLIFAAICVTIVMHAQTYTMTNGSSNTCSGTFYDSGGNGLSYGYNENLVYTFCSNSGNCVSLNFTSFNIESGYDFMYLYDGNSTASTQIGTYTGTQLNGQTITSTSGCITIRFTSDGIINNAGWAATISCAACVAQTNFNMSNTALTLCNGSWYDPGGSAGNYSNSSNFTQTICPSTAGQCVSVAFSSFSLENNYDFLSVYNGNSTGATLIGTYTGTQLSGVTLSSTAANGCLTFVFTSDFIVPDAGWAATISCGTCGGGGGGGGNTMTSGTLTACSGSWYDPGGSSSNYGNSQNIVQTICPSTAGQCVSVNFSSFSLEPFWDQIAIYNGNSTAATAFAGSPFSGTDLAGLTITSTNGTGCLTFNFVSDGITTYPGWAGTISCGTCNTSTVVTSSDCATAIPVCTNLNFSIDPNGFGSVNDIPASGTTGNPYYTWGDAVLSPWGTDNYGCLQSGETNSTWMTVNIQTGGSLEFTFGGGGTQAGYYDWIMYPWSNSSLCSSVSSGTLAPVRCNWNFANNGGTGLAGTLPPGGNAGNFEPPLAVATGSVYLICFSNWSSATTTVPLQFGGTAVVSCTVLPLLLNDFTGVPKNGINALNWSALNENGVNHYEVYYSKDGIHQLKVAEVAAVNNNQQAEYSYDHIIDNSSRSYYELRGIGINNEVIVNRTITLAPNDIVRDEMKVFPNPSAQNDFMVEYPVFENENLSLCVYSVDGTLMMQSKLNSLSKQHNLSAKSLNNGLYILKIQNEEGKTFSKSKFILNR